jgi:hypothetical protein
MFIIMMMVMSTAEIRSVSFEHAQTNKVGFQITVRIQLVKYNEQAQGGIYANG